MDAKEYLGQIRRSDARLEALRFEIERLDNLSRNLSSKPLTQDRVLASGSQDKVANITAKLMDKKAKYERLIDENEHKREVIIKQIYSLDDLTSSQILFSIYFENRSYGDLAEEMNYSYDHIRRLSRKALNSFQKECNF